MNADPLGYYALLGVAPRSSQPELKAAFRRRARRLHPDVSGTGDAGAFRDLNSAYQILSDPDLRADYDRSARDRSALAEPHASAAFAEPASVVARPARSALWAAGLGVAVLALVVATTVYAAGAQDGWQAVTLAGGGIAYVDAARLMAGDARDAERARCAYSAGAAPANGEVLTRGGAGTDRLRLDNREPISAIVTLHDRRGRLAARAFVAAEADATLTGLPPGPWTEQAEFGEIWSRACGRFVTGVRTHRSDTLIAPGASVAIQADTPDE